MTFAYSQHCCRHRSESSTFRERKIPVFRFLRHKIYARALPLSDKNFTLKDFIFFPPCARNTLLFPSSWVKKNLVEQHRTKASEREWDDTPLVTTTNSTAGEEERGEKVEDYVREVGWATQKHCQYRSLPKITIHKFNNVTFPRFRSRLYQISIKCEDLVISGFIKKMLTCPIFRQVCRNKTRESFSKVEQTSRVGKFLIETSFIRDLLGSRNLPKVVATISHVAIDFAEMLRGFQKSKLSWWGKFYHVWFSSAFVFTISAPFFQVESQPRRVLAHRHIWW